MRPDWLQTNITETQEVRYWFRTPMGLEKLATEEIVSLLPVAEAYQSHRNVFVHLSVPNADHAARARQSRLADDVYVYWGSCQGIDRTKDSLRHLIPFLKAVLEPALSAYGSDTPIRPTVSFVGKRNFSRFFVEAKISQLIQEHTNFQTLSNEEEEGKLKGELRLRCHIEDDLAYIGLGLQDTPLHRRSWRNIRYPGQLHTPVAGAIARAIDAPAGSHLLDPFSGSGTILIESGLTHSTCTCEGWDISEEALDIARQSAQQAAVKADFLCRDSLATLPLKRDYYLISNPPWDEKHQINDGSLERFISGLARLVQQSVASVLLLPEELVSLLEEQLEHHFERIATTRVRGKLALIIRYTVN